jgi:ATP-dependent DNA helicase PIF1
MPSLQTIERKWIKNFSKSNLIDINTGLFNVDIIIYLLHNESELEYPSDFPSGFEFIYLNHNHNSLEENVEIILDFLNFIGISLRKTTVMNHLSKYPNDLEKLFRKTFYILRTLSNYDETLDLNNPFYDNNGDLYFLLRIESELSIRDGQLSLFEDLDLPDLYNKYIDFPPGYEDDLEVKDLFELIEFDNESFFITGKAGTGKSTFIQYFATKSRKNVLLTAFTGIAAINIGGVTLHSFFQFPIKPLMPNDEGIVIFNEYSQKRKIIEKLETIVIDEVSMLRSDLLEAINFSLRNNGGDPSRPFGGKQIIFVGDVFQLPPVFDEGDEAEHILFNEIYNSEYFFDSPAYRELDPFCFEFKTSHRQKNDMPFVQLLDKVRVCQVLENDLNKLNERYFPNHNSQINDFLITLTSNNYLAKEVNIRKLMELPYASHYFEAEIIGEFKPDRYPADKFLELRKGSQIIFIKNDSYSNGRRWVNGTIAIVDFISKNSIDVRFQNGSVYSLERVEWQSVRHKFDRGKRKIVSEIIGSFKQFPIKLAWAITIHKSQGLTFDNVVLDLGTGAFANGQLYTGLSRCRTLNGIILKKRIKKSDIILDDRLVKFYSMKFAPSNIGS